MEGSGLSWALLSSSIVAMMISCVTAVTSFRAAYQARLTRSRAASPCHGGETSWFKVKECERVCFRKRNSDLLFRAFKLKCLFCTS